MANGHFPREHSKSWGADEIGLGSGCRSGGRRQLFLHLRHCAHGRWCANKVAVVFPLSAYLSADPGGDRHAESCHPVEYVAPDLRLGPLIGQNPGVKSSADDGRVAKHRLSTKLRRLYITGHPQSAAVQGAGRSADGPSAHSHHRCRLLPVSPHLGAAQGR
jgi:hypothetical protein